MEEVGGPESQVEAKIREAFQSWQDVDPSLEQLRKARMDWLRYNQRWDDIQDYIRQQYPLQSRFSKDYQPAFLATAIPWPVEGLQLCNVTDKAVYAFLDFAIDLDWLQGTVGEGIARDCQNWRRVYLMHARRLIDRKRERWWSFVDLMDRELIDINVKKLEDGDGRKKLLNVVNGLEKLRSVLEGRILQKAQNLASNLLR